MQAAGVRDVEAFIAFQKGQTKFWQAHSHEIDMAIMAEAADWFTEALRLEPRFASAYFMRSDYHAHRATLYGLEDGDRRLAYAAYMSDLEAASANVSSPDERALIEVDRTLASDNWRTLPERFDAALASRSCAEGVWIELAPPFGMAEEYMAYTKAMIGCDPLNFYFYYSAGLSALWTGRRDEALELMHRGLDIAPDDPFLEAGLVLALLAQQRFDEARERAASRDLWNRDLKLALVDAASGDLERARERAAEVIADSGPWLKMFHTLQLSAVTGQREAANAAAAWFDSLPMGPMMLMGVISECLCGAPFDLDATPALKQRLEEADAPWPPVKIIDYPAMGQ
jgi:tetratricopeptide (TPR) repeat protein